MVTSCLAGGWIGAAIEPRRRPRGTPRQAGGLGSPFSRYTSYSLSTSSIALTTSSIVASCCSTSCNLVDARPLPFLSAECAMRLRRFVIASSSLTVVPGSTFRALSIFVDHFSTPIVERTKPMLLGAVLLVSRMYLSIMERIPHLRRLYFSSISAQSLTVRLMDFIRAGSRSDLRTAPTNSIALSAT